MATKSTTRAVKTELNGDEETVAEVKSAKADKPIVPKAVDLSELITVKSGYSGKLIYVSPRTRERFVWDNLGDEQEIELRELRNARSSAKSYFLNNWFMFGPEFEWVVEYLGMGRYYKNAIKPDEFDDFFELPADELRERLTKLTDGQKKTVGYMARQKVVDGEIDSRKTISTLEEVLNIQLIEK